MAPIFDDPSDWPVQSEAQILAAVGVAAGGACQYFALRRMRDQLLRGRSCAPLSAEDVARFRRVQLRLRTWDSPGRLPYMPEELDVAVRRHHELLLRGLLDEQVAGPSVAS